MKSVLYQMYFLIILKDFLVICEPYDNKKIQIIEVPSTNEQELNRSVVNHQESMDKELRVVKNHVSTSSSTDSTSISAPELSNGKKIPKEECKVPLQLFPLKPQEKDYVEEVHPSENIIESKFIYPGLINTLQPTKGRFSQLSGSDFDGNTVKFNNFDESEVSEPILDIYPARRQTSDEDILEQLEHDAIIHNILPTMDEPFFRDTAKYSAESDLQLSTLLRPELVGYYSQNLPLPLLVRFQCTPKITRMYQQTLPVPLPYNYYHGTYAPNSGEMELQL